MYRDLESITEKTIVYDYTDIFTKINERGITFTKLKEILSLEENCFQLIKEKKMISLSDEQKIITYFDLKSSFMKKEYYFDYPMTREGISDKWKAIELFEKLKSHHFTILVDKKSNGENKYKIIGNINGSIYEREDNFAYDTSAIIVFASYVEENLS